MISRFTILAAAAVLASSAVPASAVTIFQEKQTVSEEAALAMIATCKDYALKNNWKVAIAVVDSMGNLVAYDRMQGSSQVAAQAAPLKAKTALRWRRPSKLIGDRFAQGNEEAVWLGDLALQGGLPIIVNGKAIGGIASGGASSAQDEECAMAGLKAVLGDNPPMQETN